MKSNFGNCFRLSLFGESHSEAIGITISGLAAGISLDLAFIEKQLSKRKAYGKISTARQEEDKVRFISGYYNGFTTGTPLCLLIENADTKSRDYDKLKNIPRPSHADFTGYEKYEGFGDHRGGGHFSGRLTAPIVAAGAIASQLLIDHNITIATHIKSLCSVYDAPFSEDFAELQMQADLLNDSLFPTIDALAKQNMTTMIEAAANDGDSLGGVLETVVLNLPAGIGEPFFDSVESKLSALLFSIPGVKGVEFGAGFDLSNMKGSRANDPFYTDGSKVFTKTNNSGGINGGITNGMPVKFQTAIRPTPSIYKPQESVDLLAMENATLQIAGRHDPAIIHRARVVVDSMAAIGLCDFFCEKYGSEWTKPRA